MGVNLAALARSPKRGGRKLSEMLDAAPTSLEVPDYGTPEAYAARAAFNGELARANGGLRPPAVKPPPGA